MTKRSFLIVLICLMVFLSITGCGGAQTSTPDPCSDTILPETVAAYQAIMTEFDDTTFIANLTPQQSLTDSLYRLQDIRRRMEALPSAECVATLQQTGVNYMNSVVTYLGYFMGGATRDQVSGAIASSQSLRILYETEQARLLGTSYTPPPTITPLPPATEAPMGAPTEETILGGVVVTNLAVEPVNLRAAPSVDAELVGQLTAGAQANAVATNSTRDWLLIDFNGSQVWVFAQLVQVAGSVDTLPIQDVAVP